MKTLKLFISILVAGVIFSMTTVFAAETQGALSTQTKAEQTAAALMAKQKTKAMSEIERRVNSLNKAIEKINEAKKITTEQKNAFVSQVQAEITSLTQLKDKINADTDKTTLLSDRKAIVTQYRIFALFEPEMAIISYADKILNIVDLMDSKTSDATIKAKIADARTKAQKAITDVSVLKPEEYPGNKSVLQASKQLLVDARKELIEARAMMKPATPNNSETPANTNASGSNNSANP